MEIGIAQLMPAFAYDGISDATLYANEIAMARAGEDFDYDHIWVVEHHFGRSDEHT